MPLLLLRVLSLSGTFVCMYVISYWKPRKYQYFSTINTILTTPIWRSGRNTRLLRKRSRVRIPHSTNICMPIVLLLLCYMRDIFFIFVTWCVLKKFMYLSFYKYNNINPLSGIHNTSLTMDNREYECLEYLFFFFIVKRRLLK
jgi:hypothetical protein